MDSDPVTGSRERPLAGLGRFTWLVGVGTALALAIAAVGYWAMRPRGAPEPAPALAPRAPPAAARGALRPEPAPELAGPGAVGPVAREVERRHAAGELADAQRRFEPCPGGDLRRVAWIEQDQRVVKLTRHRADGLLVEEWFDGEGRLREALVRGTAGGRPWARHVLLDERGHETEVGPAAPSPPQPPPALVRGDPTGAFFGQAGCTGPR